MTAIPNAARLLEAAEAAHRAEDMRDLERLARELIAACEPSGDPRVAHGHLFLGVARGRQNDSKNANAHCDRALELFTAANDREGVLRAKVALAAIAGEVDLNPARAHQLALEALVLARDFGDPARLAVALGNYAEVCRQEGDYAGAIKNASESAVLYEKAERFARAAAQYGVMAQVHVVQRDVERAIDDLEKAWILLQREPIARHCAWYFEVWTIIAVALQQYESAARLYGFVGHFRDVEDAKRLPGILPRLSAPVERVFSHLGAHHADELVAEGMHMTLESAQALAETIRPPV